MTQYVTGAAIRTLREKKHYTQKQLADLLCVSDKTVSKWENGRGFPDIALLEPLAQHLGVSVAELLSGQCVTNHNRAGNMLRTKFYVCPLCGNVIHATGTGVFSCCGITLPPLEVEEPEVGHEMRVECIDQDYYVTLDHPMTKTHYISFLAYITSDWVQLRKLYPEQEAAGRFTRGGVGRIYAYCNQHGLFEVKPPRYR